MLADPKSGAKERRRIARQDAFRTADIALPRVLTIEEDGQARPLDAESDLFPAIDWTQCDLTAFADALPDNAPPPDTQLVRLRTAATRGLETERASRIETTQDFDAAYAVRMIGDIVPNPFAARALVEQVLERLEGRGWGADLIGRLAGFIIDELRKVLGKWRDERAAAIFRARLDSGAIEFRVRGDADDWIAPDHIWTTEPAGAAQVPATNGGPLQRSLFLPIYAADLNPDERKVAVYLDDEAMIRWCTATAPTGIATDYAAGGAAMFIRTSCWRRCGTEAATGSWRWSRRAINWLAISTRNISARCWRR